MSAQAYVEGAPQGIFTGRLVFQLDRVPSGQPVRMTLITRTNTAREQVVDALDHPLIRLEQRAPHVYDCRLPNTMVPRLAEIAGLFRLIDLAGLVFGLQVPARDAHCHVVIDLDEPLTSERRAELRNRGILIRREGFGNVSGETTGGVLADLALCEWIGPIRVKRVAMPESFARKR